MLRSEKKKSGSFSRTSLRTLAGFVLILIMHTSARAQCSVTIPSSNGYSVIVRVLPVKVIPSTTNCPWGYNYNIALNYSVSFTGSNIPGALYNLQGNVICNSQSLFFSLPTSGGTGSFTTTTNPYVSSDGGAYVYTSRPSCTAATINNMNCNTVNITISGPGISNQVVSCSFGSPLPIQLSSFSGEKKTGHVFLTWQTETEKDNASFIIEKSLDGIEWIQIATLPGAGNSLVRKNYVFSDDSPEAGVNYYRLKQTDYDGTYSYSPVIAVLNSTELFHCSAAWPNPTRNEFRLLIDAPVNGRAVYTIINETGGEVAGQTFSYQAGGNEVHFSLGDVPEGFYLMEIRFDEKNRIYRKLVKI
jgi:hypothetical protein